MLLDPKLNFPKADKNKPVWMKVRMGRENPKVKKSQVDVTKPNRAGDLNNNSKSRWTESSTNIKKPNCALPHAGNGKSKRAGCRRNIGGSRCKGSNTSKAKSIREMERTNDTLPRCACSMTGNMKTGPTRAMPNSDEGLSMQPKLCEKTEKPVCKRSNTDRSGPDHAKLCTGKKESGTAQSGAKRGEPIITGSGAEMENSGLALLIGNIMKPGLKQLLSSKDEPGSRKSTTNKAKPSCAQDRADSKGSDLVASMTKSEKRKPRHPMPNKDSLSPTRAKPCTNIKGPMCKESKTDATRSTCARDRTGKEKPRCKKSKASRLGPKRATPSTRKLNSTCAKDWIDVKGDPKAHGAKAKVAEPEHPNDLKEECKKDEKPKRAWSKAKDIESNRAVLRANEGDPKCAVSMADGEETKPARARPKSNAMKSKHEGLRSKMERSIWRKSKAKSAEPICPEDRMNKKESR
ncbi:Uncharacterized protein SCF082_LOCUS33394 [Durusdinium trenchii]|uniref:Uncharacterized protein n=1 Tax=Durusdinium trenchii TaxID=1381693 RepID=A0ABP0NPM1_9DINO